MSCNDDIKRKIEEYGKKIDELSINLDDDHSLGYFEAILNLFGIFTNGECEDCPFSYDVEVYNYDFIYPEYDLKCRLDKCWIDTAKELFKE